MKQLLFLLLFPAFAMAQYPGNAGQKITLGEQTTADGLVYRGVASIDTVTATSKITRANKQDTSAYILLDTVTNLLWHYKTASNAWTQAGGGVSVSSFSAGTTGLTPSTATTGAVTLGGILALENGGTGSATKNFVDLTTTQSVAGAKTFTSAVTASGVSDGTESILTIQRTETGATAKPTLLNIYNFNSGFQVGGSAFIGYSAYNAEFFFKASARAGLDDINFYTKDGSTEFNRFKIKNDGETLIGYTADNGAYKLQVNGQIFATNATIATSDEKYKENITPLNKGLEIVNKLKPVTFNFISDTKNNFSEYEEVGFIAQDVDRALSTETFSKSIVKAADDSDPTSTMGLATQNLIPILVKAIQEQQALIKALEQRIINLENK